MHKRIHAWFSLAFQKINNKEAGEWRLYAELSSLTGFTWTITTCACGQCRPRECHLCVDDVVCTNTVYTNAVRMQTMLSARRRLKQLMNTQKTVKTTNETLLTKTGRSNQKQNMYQMPSQKPDISKNILQNVLPKHIHVTSLTDNIQTNIKVMINTKWEQLAVEFNWFIFLSVQAMLVKTIF